MDAVAAVRDELAHLVDHEDQVRLARLDLSLLLGEVGAELLGQQRGRDPAMIALIGRHHLLGAGQGPAQR